MSARANIPVRPTTWARLRTACLGCVAAWLAVCADPCVGGDDVPRAVLDPPRPVFLTPIAVSDANQTPTQPAPTPVEPQSGAKDFIAPPPAAIAGTALLAADEQPIDFLGALQLAEAQNPDIGLSRQAIQDALAQQLQARSLMLPSVHVGANYRDHQGILQTSSGKMLDVDFSSLYVGNGALATAAGTTVIPGIQMFGNVSDGIFAPLAARQLVASRGFQAQAASNQILLEVAQRFVDLVRAEGDLHALLLSEKDTDQAVQITRAFARAQQGRDADARRAETTALLLHSKTLRAEENLLTASAELVRVLSLDPAIRLRAMAQPNAMLELVDAGQELERLLNAALAARPELAALSADIARRQVLVQQERARPFLPTISLGFSAGGFGGGPTGSFSRLSNRTDADLVAYWTLQNMGAGNRALQKERLSERDQTVLEKERMANLVAREVADARALVLAGREDVEIARSRIGIAENAFREDLKRIRLGGGKIGLPIELLNSLNLLTDARLGLVRTLRDYDLAQIQLFVAIGQNPLALSSAMPR